MTDQAETAAPTSPAPGSSVATADPDPDLDFGQALGTLFRRFYTSAGAAVDDLPGGPRGFQVMSVAAESSCGNQARIAERLGLDRTVMTYLIDDLEAAGLVERRPDPADRRARQVLLTESGRASFRQATERIEHVERAVLAGLSDADAARFRELLMRVVTTGGTDGGDGAGGGAHGVNACEIAEATELSIATQASARGGRQA